MVDREELEFISHVAEPLRDREPVEPDFEARILSAVKGAARPEVLSFNARKARRASRASAGWLVARRKLEISPLAGLAAAACFAAIVASTTVLLSAKPRASAGAVGAVAADSAMDDKGLRLVHFAIVAPTAGKVTLVGDFNAWNARSTPMVKGAVEGLWLVTVPLGTGSYQYAFVIDETRWTADPAAAVALEDEFGTPSSILNIREGST
jgi:hypothetical protein